MKNKIVIALLLVVASVKAFSQIITPQSNTTISGNNKFAIIEICRYSNRNGTTTLFYGGGKMEDLSGILYNTVNNRYQYLPDLPADDYKENETISEPLKALICIQYMSEKNYVLVSSNSTNWNGNYTYQYVFEKKEK